MATKLDIVNAQFIGFRTGKWHRNDIIRLVEEMNLTKKEWNKLKDLYTVDNDIDEDDFKEIEEYFKI